MLQCRTSAQSRMDGIHRTGEYDLPCGSQRARPCGAAVSPRRTSGYTSRRNHRASLRFRHSAASGRFPNDAQRLGAVYEATDTYALPVPPARVSGSLVVFVVNCVGVGPLCGSTRETSNVFVSNGWQDSDDTATTDLRSTKGNIPAGHTPSGIDVHSRDAAGPFLPDATNSPVGSKCKHYSEQVAHTTVGASHQGLCKVGVRRR